MTDERTDTDRLTNEPTEVRYIDREREREREREGGIYIEVGKQGVILHSSTICLNN